MSIRLFSLLTLSFAFYTTIGQNVESLKLTRNDLPGMEETRSAAYNENSLWGYINGGADLYLEYGFKEVLAQDFVWETEPFKIDMYVMNSPESAFGIYSVSRFSCKTSGSVAKWDCVNPYQVQVAYGNIYLSVVAYNGTERSMELATKIAQKAISRFRVKQFDLPKYIPVNELKISTSDVKLITGQLAMQNSYVSLENQFLGIENYKLWVIPIKVNSQVIDLLMASFESENDCEKVAEQILAKNSDKTNYQLMKNELNFFALKNFDKDIHPEIYQAIIEAFSKM